MGWYPEPGGHMYKLQKNVVSVVICSIMSNLYKYIQDRKNVHQGKYTWIIPDTLCCKDENVIYKYNAKNKTKKETPRYVGETKIIHSNGKSN